MDKIAQIDEFMGKGKDKWKFIFKEKTPKNKKATKKKGAKHADDQKNSELAHKVISNLEI
jgi:hypothetical protein